MREIATDAVLSRNADRCSPGFTPAGRYAKANDLHRETEPKFVGDFGLRGSVCAGLTGRIAVGVAQVSTSSNWVEGLLFFPKIPAVAVRWEMYGPPSDCKLNLCGECFGSAQMYPACLWS